MSKLKITSFRILFNTISLSIIRFSTYDSDIKIDENKEILKIIYKE